jgi:hypothetical protein
VFSSDDDARLPCSNLIQLVIVIMFPTDDDVFLT